MCKEAGFTGAKTKESPASDRCLLPVTDVANNVALLSRERFMFLFCFAATDLRLANDISAPHELHFQEVSAKRQTCKNKAVCLLTKTTCLLRVPSIKKKIRGGGERLLTLPDTPSPTLGPYRRRLPPDKSVSCL